MLNLVAFVDGGSLGNPGPSGIGVVIEGSETGTIRIAKWIGHQDNNVAEYVALLEALQCALSLRAKALHVYSDSEVMVRQMRGEYNCRCPRLYSLNWCVLPRCWLPRRSWRLEHNQCHGPFHFCCSSPSTSRSPAKRFMPIGHSCPESRGNPQCANGSKHECEQHRENA